MGLDDANTENGCLYYVPGSHKWGLLDKPALAGEMDGLMQFLSNEQKSDFKPIPVEMTKGYGVFHHPLLIHGSYENKSDRSRRAAVINVFSDNTVSNTDEVILDGVPLFKKGKKLKGQFFPLLKKV
jgi:ectoine hydroxylase-related dioxygenase (phytanoyl-CoA dioxygenase family)